MRLKIVCAAMVMAALLSLAAGERGRGALLRPPPPPKVSTPQHVSHLVDQLSSADLRRLLEFAAAVELNTDSVAPSVDTAQWEDIQYGNEIEPQFPQSNGELVSDSPPFEYGVWDMDAAVAQTAESQSVVAAEYGAEDVGALPLMLHRNSKLHHTSSYSVPHYTVTGSAGYHKTPRGSYSAPSAGKAPSSSYSAPSKESAVWVSVFRSRGPAYTLHDDGSLTPER